MRPFLGTGLIFVCVTLAGLSPVLGTQTPIPSPSPSPLQPGETVPPFDAEGLDGTVQHVSYPKGSTTLILFFLSGCSHCHKQIPEWNRFYESRPKRLQVWGLLLDREPPGFFMAIPVAFPVLRSPGREFAETFKVRRVPMTLRVGGGGVVEDIGMGEQEPIRLGQLFRP